MSHRRAGLKGIQQRQQQRQQFQAAGEALQKDQLDHMKLVLATFKTQLEDFARAHSSEIKKNAVFRSHFQLLCSKVGVDPLASNKGFWTELLGFGDYYYEIAVQITQICISTRDRNGGFIEFGEMKRSLEKLRGSKALPVSDDDIVQSLKCLKPLGDGFKIVQFGSRKMIQSVPEELLSQDHSSVLSIAEDTGYVSVDSITSKLSWEPERAQECLNTMIKEVIYRASSDIDISLGNMLDR